MRTFANFEELRASAGGHLGYSAWRTPPAFPRLRGCAWIELLSFDGYPCG